MKKELVAEALKKIEYPEVLINVISRRVRELGQSHVPMVTVTPRMTFMEVALKEVAEGKLTYKLLSPAPGMKQGVDTV